MALKPSSPSPSSSSPSFSLPSTASPPSPSPIENPWELVHEGAEARLYLGWWLGERAVYKMRVPKAYRHPTLDHRLRSRRTRVEARLLFTAAEAGVRVPSLLQVRPSHHLIVEEWIDGQVWKAALGPDRGEPEPVGEPASRVGKQVALAHREGLAHGDLTTSNVVLSRSGPVLLDWGLGRLDATLEQQGLDLQVLWECVGASHPDVAHEVLEGFTAGYRLEWPGAEAVLERRKTIANRGRYL